MDSQWFRRNIVANYISPVTIDDATINGPAIHKPWVKARSITFILQGTAFGALLNGIIGLQGLNSAGTWVFLNTVGRNPVTGAPGGTGGTMAEGALLAENSVIDDGAATLTFDLQEIVPCDDDMTDIRLSITARDDVATLSCTYVLGGLYGIVNGDAADLDHFWTLQHYDNAAGPTE